MRTKNTDSRLRLAFASREETAAGAPITVHVNFGVFTGREATPAEIDQLAEQLLHRAEHVTIVSEAHHEIDRHSEAAVSQVRIEVPRAHDERERAELERWLVREAERWTRRCGAERPDGTGEVDPEL
jgi:hypothetical protein